MPVKRYHDTDVLTAARKRISDTFDDFARVYVAFSGGKDSSVMLHLVMDEAIRRDRKVAVMFIDMEAQYADTIAHVEEMFAMYKEHVDPHWICIPMLLRNAVTNYEPRWVCWDEDRKDAWVRQKPERAKTEKDYPFAVPKMEFEEFIVLFGEWYGRGEPTAGFIGIRAQESLHRYCAVATWEKLDLAWKGRRWTTNVVDRVYNIYPIYDWLVDDVWTYHGKHPDRPHNRVYDRMHQAGVKPSQQRLCQPFGDDQRKGLWLYHILEPRTWAKLVARVNGANSGALYVEEVGNVAGYGKITLPPGHTWKSFCNLLLRTMPKKTRDHYTARFRKFIWGWKQRGYSNIPDESPLELEAKCWAPSWRRMCKVLLRNDYWCKGLGQAQPKSDAYQTYKAIKAARKRMELTPPKTNGRRRAMNKRTARERELDAILDEVVQKCGGDRDSPHARAALMLQGIDPDDGTVTDRTWDLAVERAARKITSAADGRVLEWVLSPLVLPGRLARGDSRRWETACGRYRITRHDDRGRAPAYYAEYRVRRGEYDTIEHYPHGTSTSCMRYDYLEDAARAVLRHHRKEFDLLDEEITHNTAAMLTAEYPAEGGPDVPAAPATDMMLCGGPDQAPPAGSTPPEPDEEVPMTTATATAEVLKVKASAARRLLVALGKAEAADWTSGKLEKVLSNRERFSAIAVRGEAEDARDKRLLAEIVEVHKDGGDIEVEDDGSPATSPVVEEESGSATPAAVRKRPGRPKGSGKEEKPDKKSGAKATKPTGTKRKSDSMVSIVINLLRAASAAKPITKDRIHAAVMRKFPDHNPDSVRDSIGWYITTMKKKQDVEVKKDGKGGFWID